jgi:hypothetical protein
MSTKSRTDLTVRSFAYVAGQLARSSATSTTSSLYEQILGEAEKHRSALRLVQRDAFETLEQRLRSQALSKAEFHRFRRTEARSIEQAEQAINLIAAQYAPRRLAA